MPKRGLCQTQPILLAGIDTFVVDTCLE